MITKLPFKILFITFLAVFTAVSCSSIPTETDEDLVSARALAHEQALIENDFKAAYTFLTPGYRAAFTYKNYLGTKGSAVKRESAKIRSVNCEENTCIVQIDLYYRYQGLQGIHTKPEDESAHRVNEEKWIKIEGQWWLYKQV